MTRAAAAFAAGLIFGCGILLSGMANPAKILNFFDVAGAWDPSLAFVMGGALGVAAVGYRLAWRRGRPLCDEAFHPPTKSDIDARLIGGAALFGAGWGVVGFCPGGAIPALAFMRGDVALFVAALVVGIVGARALDRLVSPLLPTARTAG
jgi:uncharacterized membrane protein YedE/YeeE